ncbi:hypothetical protein [Caldicellulosiruptor morganii]|uniref:Uncharacterized protein n=1 Tax=Caldicellulosiruptor morganii TaxID=1387555 RepID=A0ABY7BN74_9FIRM|nr:hypothetical protein [Caldicellulosiruptor morganii]WAM32976.1 hypothetical protein OTK00_001432 [Caldicellulosiruptor morganii]
MFAPRCDIFFDTNLVNLKEFSLPIETKNALLEEFSKIEDVSKAKSHLIDELKELDEKIKEIQ